MLPKLYFRRLKNNFLKKTNNLYITSCWLEFLEKTFGWETKYILFDEDKIPAIVKRKLNFAKIASSLPFAHAMPDLKLNNPQNYKDQLLKLGVAEFNYHGKIDSDIFKHYCINSIIKIDLTGFESSSDLFKKLNKDSIQRKINKAIKSEFKVEVLNDLKDYNNFQIIQTETRKRQGSPTYPNNFFINLKKHLKDYVNLFGIYHNGKLISGIITFNYNNYAVYAYGASESNEEYFKLGVNQLCLWESIKFAKENNNTIYDFGSTPNHHHSLMEYKLKWASFKEDLVYSYYSADNKPVPIINRASKAALLLERSIKLMPNSLFKLTTPYLLKMAVY
jgi:lipid II:glycine glycyltransferase (peptidoglycan interpeptide bridge formation enzyme)